MSAPRYHRNTDLSFLGRMDGLGTTEDDANDIPDYAPDTRDPHGYFTLNGILSYVLVGALSAIGALLIVMVLS